SGGGGRTGTLRLKPETGRLKRIDRGRYQFAQTSSAQAAKSAHPDRSAQNKAPNPLTDHRKSVPGQAIRHSAPSQLHEAATSVRQAATDSMRTTFSRDFEMGRIRVNSTEEVRQE